MSETLFALLLIDHRWHATCELCGWEAHCTDIGRITDLGAWETLMRRHANAHRDGDASVGLPLRWKYDSINLLGNAHDAVKEFSLRFPEAEIVSIPANGEHGVPHSCTIVVYRYLEPPTLGGRSPITATASDDTVDRIIFQVLNTLDRSEAWHDARLNPESYRQAVRLALKQKPLTTGQDNEGQDQG